MITESNSFFKGKVLLKFGATWCGPCKIMKTTIDRFIKDNETIKIVEYDSALDSIVFTQYSVSSVPTIILLNDNKEIKRHTGLMTYDQLSDFILG